MKITKRLLTVILSIALILTTLPLSGLFAFAEGTKTMGTLKILALGNSFSQDAMYNLGYMLDDVGYTDVVLGNAVIGGCTLDTHWSNIEAELADSTSAGAYSFEYYKNGKWTTEKEQRIDYALDFADWDIITIQQASHYSGYPAAQPDAETTTFEKLRDIVSYLDTNKPKTETKIYWHMTWAYAATSSHSGFSNYNKDQATMYNAIVNTVTDTVLAIDGIDGVIPSGTAIQNLRTSYVGDNLTRDGYHMNNNGRYTAALTWFATLTGLPTDVVGYTMPEEYWKLSQTDEVEPNIKAIRQAVNAAVKTPYTVTEINSYALSDTLDLTESDIAKLDASGYTTENYKALNLDMTLSSYYDSSINSYLNTVINSDLEDLKYYAGSALFEKADIPTGSVIMVDEGYEYRPEGWATYNYAVENRQEVVTSDSVIEVNDAWWYGFKYRAFNLSYSGAEAEMTEADLDCLRVYIPINNDTDTDTGTDTGTDIETTESWADSSYYKVLDDTNIKIPFGATKETENTPDGNGYYISSTNEPKICNLDFPSDTQAIVFWFKLATPGNKFYLTEIGVRTTTGEANNTGMSSTAANGSETKTTNYYHFLNTNFATANSVSAYTQTFSATKVQTGDHAAEKRGYIDEGYFVLPISNFSADLQTLIKGETNIDMLLKKSTGMGSFYIDRIGAITDLDAFYKDVGIDTIASPAAGSVKDSQNWKLGIMSATDGFAAPVVESDGSSVNVNFKAYAGAKSYYVNAYDSNYTLVKTIHTSSTSVNFTELSAGSYNYQVVANDDSGDIASSAITTETYTPPYYEVLDDTNIKIPFGATKETENTPDGNGYYISGTNEPKICNLDFPSDTQAIVFWFKLATPGNNFYLKEIGVRTTTGESNNTGMSSTAANGSETKTTNYYHFLNTNFATANSVSAYTQTFSATKVQTGDHAADKRGYIDEGYFVLPISNFSADLQTLIKGETNIDMVLKKSSSMGSLYIDRIGAITDLDAFYKDVGIDTIASPAVGSVKDSQNWKLGIMSATDGFAKPAVSYKDGVATVGFGSVDSATTYIVNEYNQDGALIKSVETTETAATFAINEEKPYSYQVVALDSDGADIAASGITTFKYTPEIMNVINLIDAIGEVRFVTSEPAVTAARNAYDALSSDEQVYVYNIDTLTAAEEILNNTDAYTPSMQDVKIDYSTEENEIIFSAVYPEAAPDGFEISEIGMLTTNDANADIDAWESSVVTDSAVTMSVTDCSTRYSAKAYVVLKNTSTEETYTFYSENSDGRAVDGVITSSYNDIVLADATLLVQNGTALDGCENITQIIGSSNVEEFVKTNAEALEALESDTVSIDLTAGYVKILGRYHTDETSLGIADVNSGFTFKFVGGGAINASIALSGSESSTSYIETYIDGVAAGDVALSADQTEYTLAEGIAYGEHEVTVVKRNEYNTAAISSVSLAKGSYLCNTTAEKTRKIEFIGDNVTVGYGNVAIPYSTLNSDSSQTFAWYLGEKYDADIFCRAHSDWGVSWNASGSTDGAVSTAYENTTIADSIAWDFESNQVDLVCINLGTNDALAIDGETITSDAWIEKAVAFLTTVREKYPDAQILWSYGAVSSDFAETILAAVEQYNESKTTGSDVAYFTLGNTYTEGATGYPTSDQHHSIAEEMMTEIEKLLPDWGTVVNVYGDANGDGLTDIRDLVVMKKYSDDNSYSIKTVNADTDINGEVDATDTNNIRKDLLGLEVEDNITQYKITYKNLFGKEHSNPTIYAESVTLENISDREFYDFLGWYDEDGNEVNDLSDITKNMKLTAKWSDARVDKRTDVVDGDVSIMSYNLLSETFNTAKTASERVDGALAQIEAYMPDVIGVQETCSTTLSVWKEELTERNSVYKFVEGFEEIYNPYRQWRYNNFNQIIYNSEKLTLIEKGVQPFETSNNSNCRIMIWATFQIKATGKTFLVVNNHWDLEDSERVKQAAQMTEYVRYLASKRGIKYVFTIGDFNSKMYFESMINYLDESGYKDSGTTAAETGLLMKTYTSWSSGTKLPSVAYTADPTSKGDFTEAIDHITYNPEKVTANYFTVVYNKLSWYASDHCPVFATFTLAD